MGLRVEIRQLQNYDNLGNPYVYTLPYGTQTAGTVAQPTFIDVTEFCSALDGANGTFSVKFGNEGARLGDFSPSADKLGISSEFTVVGYAYDFITNYVVFNPLAGLHAIEVLITWDCSGSSPVVFRPFIITQENVSLGSCGCREARVTLTENDKVYNCIRRTLITKSPNRLGNDFFSPASTFVHPKIRYGVYQTNQLSSYIIYGVLFQLFAYLVLIPAFVARTLRSVFNTSKVHIAPLFRTFIDNICEECDLVHEDLFFDTNELSPDFAKGSIFQNANSPYHFASYMHPNALGGIQYTSTYGGFFNNKRFQQQNAPIETGETLLNKHKPVFNMDWIERGGVLSIRRKDAIIEPIPVLDLQTLEAQFFAACTEIEYEVAERPFSTIYQYASDNTDTMGNRARSYYNNVVVSGNETSNEAFTKSKTVSFPIAPAAHTLMTSDFVAFVPDFWYILRIALDEPIASVVPLFNTLTSQWASNSFPYANDNEGNDFLVVSGEDGILTEPKIICVDNTTIGNVDGLSTVFEKRPFPAPNLRYNPTAITYFIKKIQDEAVHGNIFFSTAAGGLPNYQMTIDPYFKDNLFWYFHYIDDAKYYPPIANTFTTKLVLTPYFISLFGLIAGQQTKLAYKIVLENGMVGVMNYFEANFNEQTLTIKGFILP